MLRHQLTDEEWDQISEVFPPPAKTGRPPVDRRTVVNGALWILRTGAPWRDLPDEFGRWGTVWDLFDQWNADGTWDEILHRLRAVRIDAGEVDQEWWCVAGTIVRAARCAAGGGKKTIPKNRKIMR